MNSLMNAFFGPLGKQYCIFYFYAQVIAFTWFFVTLVNSIVSAHRAKRFTMLGFMKHSAMPVFVAFFSYIMSRVMYSICVGALR